MTQDRYCKGCWSDGKQFKGRANKAMDQLNAKLLKSSDASIIFFVVVLMLAATAIGAVVSPSTSELHRSSHLKHER